LLNELDNPKFIDDIFACRLIFDKVFNEANKKALEFGFFRDEEEEPYN